MSLSHKNFREQLVNSERINKKLKENYEKEVAAMLEDRLSPARKTAFIALAVFFLGQALFFGYLIVVKTLPMVAVAGFSVVILFSLTLSFIVLKIALDGVVKMKTHPTVITGIAFGCAIVLVVLSIISEPFVEPIVSIQMVVYGLFGLVVTATFFIIKSIGKSELNTREKLLEIEYRIAELAEAAGKKEG